jgi:hypothetical protein
VVVGVEADREAAPNVAVMPLGSPGAASCTAPVNDAVRVERRPTTPVLESGTERVAESSASVKSGAGSTARAMAALELSEPLRAPMVSVAVPGVAAEPATIVRVDVVVAPTNVPGLKVPVTPVGALATESSTGAEEAPDRVSVTVTLVPAVPAATVAVAAAEIEMAAMGPLASSFLHAVRSARANRDDRLRMSKPHGNEVVGPVVGAQ